MDGLLDFSLKVLNAHAEAVEAELAESFEMCTGGHARVNFDANLAFGVEMEMLFGEREQILDLLGRQIGWRAAAPVELHDGTSLGDAAADALHLLLQDVKIGRRDAFVFLNDDVAGAKEAQALAERDVHIERDGRPDTLGFFVHTFEIGGPESVVPNGRGGIAGVARAGTIVLCEEIFADMKLAAHLIEAGMGETHA